MTFEKRLQKLESIAATHAGDDEPNMPWLSTAPEPIQLYVAALVDEYWTQVDQGTNSDVAVQYVLERHPLYRPLQSHLVFLASSGELPSLRRAQAHLLYIADKKLPFYPWTDPRWGHWRLIKRDYTQHLCCRAALEAEEQDSYEVEAWRDSGTTDAEVLTSAGIGALEMDLLAADEAGETRKASRTRSG